MKRIATRARPAYAGRELPEFLRDTTPVSKTAAAGAVSAPIKVVDQDVRSLIDSALARGVVVQCKPSRRRTV